MTPQKPLEEQLRELREERAEKERQGRLPREIDRHHRFPPNERPDDPDAHPDSGWLYANRGYEVVAPPPAGPAITGTGGPDSGMDCLVEGCSHRLRIIQEFQPGDILNYLEGNEERRVVVKGDVGICILACPTGLPSHVVQMRSDALPRRTSLILP
jgi:hypothetical protein